MRTSRWVAAALALLVCSVATAQFTTRRALDTESLKARIADLNPPEKGLPENEFSLADERRSVEQEISDVRALVLRTVDSSKELEQIDSVKRQLSEVVDNIKRVDCKITEKRSDPAKQVRSAFGSVQRLIFNNDFESVPNPWEEDESLFEKNDNRNAEQKCEAWKAFIGDQEKQASLLAFPDQLRQRLLDQQKTRQENKAQASTLLDLLQKRRDAIQKKLNESQNQSSLSSNLWVVIGIIGVLSVSAILAVKLFDKEIQIEWVVSGQVIQFVTVMILLSVIMALGLAGILKENTLGTLLGGIAGYVLAQGVGRAVARDVTRNAEQQQRVTAMQGQQGAPVDRPASAPLRQDGG